MKTTRYGSPRYAQKTDQRKERNIDGLTPEGLRLVLGQQAVREVIRVWAARTHSVLVQAGTGVRSQAIRRFAEDQGVTVQEVPRADLDRLAGGAFHQGVAAFAPPLEFTPWADLMLRADLLAVALDGVVDPQNFGAVIRSAVAIASAPVIWAESSSAPLSPTTFRASAGAIEHATLCRVQSLHGTLAEASAAGINVLGLAPDADEQLHEAALRGPTIVVIGSEQKGMGRSVRKACNRLVRLHQSGKVQSLNASVAAGISLYTSMTKLGVTNS